MKKRFLKEIVGFMSLILAFNANAELKSDNEENALREFNFSGTIRAKYQNKDFTIPAEDNKFEFDVAILNIDYDSKNWFGGVEYRCYQTDKFCDFSTLVDGFLGYKINNKDNLVFGLQPIPFGPDRFWDNSFYESINSTLGLQDVHNLGINYHFEFLSKTKIDLAYFISDGGNYHGNSQDSSRYTANLIESVNTDGTSLEEKNMMLGRIVQDFDIFINYGINFSLGGSYWYSNIENKNNYANGNRNAWALFNTWNYNNLFISITGGKLSIDNEDQKKPLISSLGSFEAEYDIANDGYFYNIATSYKINNIYKDINISPYFVYSGYDKSDKSFNKSVRNILGASMNYNKFSLYTEYIMSKNDPFLGGGRDSLAEGYDNKWNKMLNLSFIYSF